jgi:mannitol/fructose-specific phosphotransferase system IIA component (Ntr-type)
MEGVIQEVSARAAEAGIGEEATIAEKLLERERAHSTVMGAGLAIPHATVPGIPEPVIGVALAPEPIQFGPPELERVRVLFVLLSPPGREREHVKLLARICRLGRHDDFIAQLGEAGSDEGVVRVIEAIDAQHV